MTKERRHEVRVDPARCVGCGLCAEDCVAHNLVLREGKAEVLRTQCIYCGYCEAICPQNAVTLTGFADRPEEFSEQTRLDPETLLQAIRTRRTVRRFDLPRHRGNYTVLQRRSLSRLGRLPRGQVARFFRKRE